MANVNRDGFPPTRPMTEFVVKVTADPITPEEELVANLREKVAELKRRAQNAVDDEIAARNRVNQHREKVNEYQALLNTYDANKRRQDMENKALASKSATNTAPARVSDPTEVMHKEAKETWDAAWTASRAMGISNLTKPEINVRLRDSLFNDYIKEQGDA